MYWFQCLFLRACLCFTCVGNSESRHLANNFRRCLLAWVGMCISFHESLKDSCGFKDTRPASFGRTCTSVGPGRLDWERLAQGRVLYCETFFPFIQVTWKPNKVSPYLFGLVRRVQTLYSAFVFLVARNETEQSIELSAWVFLGDWQKEDMEVLAPLGFWWFRTPYNNIMLSSVKREEF